MHGRIPLKKLVWALLLLLGAAMLVYLSATGRLACVWQNVVSTKTHAALFVALFLALPLVGFPISVFLLLLGVKFDTLPAVAIMFGGMAVHLAVSFPAANTLLRPVIERSLARTKYRLPQFQGKGFVWPSLIFMAVPGLSYAMKNYILSLSGVPFRYYFFIGWLVQALLGIPLVLAGRVAERRHFFWLAVFFCMAIATAYVIRRRRARRRAEGEKGNADNKR